MMPPPAIQPPVSTPHSPQYSEDAVITTLTDTDSEVSIVPLVKDQEAARKGTGQPGGTLDLTFANDNRGGERQIRSTSAMALT